MQKVTPQVAVKKVTPQSCLGRSNTKAAKHKQKPHMISNMFPFFQSLILCNLNPRKCHSTWGGEEEQCPANHHKSNWLSSSLQNTRKERFVLATYTQTTLLFDKRAEPTDVVLLGSSWKGLKSLATRKYTLQPKNH